MAFVKVLHVVPDGEYCTISKPDPDDFINGIHNGIFWDTEHCQYRSQSYHLEDRQVVNCKLFGVTVYEKRIQDLHAQAESMNEEDFVRWSHEQDNPRKCVQCIRATVHGEPEDKDG